MLKNYRDKFAITKIESLYSPNTIEFLASRKEYRNDNSIVENQWVRIWSTVKKNKQYLG